MPRWSRIARPPESTGPVVPGEEVAGLFEPFRRYGVERVAATGAGVTAVSREGGGLTVTVTCAG